MNAVQANILPLPEILQRLGYTPQKKRAADCLYLSPFREERMPSFHVSMSDNIWFDFEEERGGDIVDFACAYLESRGLPHVRKDGLTFLLDREALSLPLFRVDALVPAGKPALEILATSKTLTHPGLVRYLTEERKIPVELAQKYLIEVKVRNRETRSTFAALGMRNSDSGYELRNQFFRGCVGRKDVTVIRGAKFPAKNIHVFEGMMDMLSALADQEMEAFPGDVIVLHSLSCLSNALPYIEDYESYQRVFSWLDNDRAGEKATQLLQRIVEEQGHLDFCPMKSTYAPYKDVNESRVERLLLHTLLHERNNPA